MHAHSVLANADASAKYVRLYLLIRTHMRLSICYAIYLLYTGQTSAGHDFSQLKSFIQYHTYKQTNKKVLSPVNQSNRPSRRQQIS